MKIFLTALVGLLVSISAAAQERTLTEAEYTEISSKAQAEIYRGQHGPWRQVLETETSTEGQPEVAYTLRSVSLTVPGLGTHRIENRSFGGKLAKFESIALDGRTFSRTDDGPWKVATVKPPAGDTVREPSSPRQELEKRVEFKYMGTETYGGRKVDVYTRSEHKKMLQTPNGSTSESTSVIKVRISADGKYYRFESNADTLSGRGAAGKIRIVIEAEADPTITITPPEIAK